MKTFDKDIGWIHTKLMWLCTCGHYEKSHRPMSRTCSLCQCAQFKAEATKKGDEAPTRP